MSQAGPLPYLAWNDAEVANAARTVEYLRNGLGNTGQGRWELGAGAMCGVLYRTDDVGVCGMPADFVSPADDPAPWYDPTEPGSETFLGIVLLDLKGYDGVVKRTYTPRIAGFGGGIALRPTRDVRVWNFQAALVSSDDAGAEYGLRWLTHVLQQSDCAQCETGHLTVRLTCPPADCSDDTLGEWFSYEASLTDGPRETQPRAPGSPSGILAGCRDFIVVEWQITAGNPFLYKRPELVADGVTIEV